MSTGVVIDSLSCYRLVRLAQRDTFPPIARMRARLRKTAWGQGEWGELLDCAWCLSVYVGAGVVLVGRTAPGPWRVVAQALAASAVSGIITTILDR